MLKLRRMYKQGGMVGWGRGGGALVAGIGAVIRHHNRLEGLTAAELLTEIGHRRCHCVSEGLGK
jgi:hypothetical protein